MSRPIALVTAEPVADVVMKLEMLLEQARAGEVISFAAVCHTKDRYIRFAWDMPEGMRQSELVGAVRFLEHKMCVDWDDGS